MCIWASLYIAVQQGGLLTLEFFQRADIFTVVVMSTSGVTTSLDRRDPNIPESHLIFCIVSLLFCPPLGIAAILSSIQVKVAVGMNNMALARQSSERAARMSMIAVFLGSNIAMLIATLVFAIIYQADSGL